jgi:hypothetical protein
LEGVFYVVRPEAISRQLPVARDSWNTEIVLVQTQLSIVQFQESTSCEQCSVKEELPAQSLQLCFNCDIRSLAFVCYQTRNCVLYLLCVISAIVAINSLVKSEESTLLLPRAENKHVTIQTNSVVLVRKRTIPTERPPHVGEVSANFMRIEGVSWSAQRIPKAAISVS